MGRSDAFIQDVVQHVDLAKIQTGSNFWAKSIGSAERVRQEYISRLANLEINNRVIFYETMSGDRINDNPFAIFEYLRSHPEYGSFLHVWSAGKDATIPDKYLDQDDVVFVRRNSQAYAYFLACAGHVICNVNLPGYFIRRAGQRYLNTWHGVPYKSLGRDSVKAKFGLPASITTFVKATHVLTTCNFMTEAIISAYSMAGVSNARIAETGYPRVDLTVNASSEEREKIRQAIGIKTPEGSNSSRPTVLYAPTWRSENGEDVVDLDKLMRDLDALADLDINLLYRGHHRVTRLIQDNVVASQVGRIIIPSHVISSNELLTVVDILITDYSSIFFDFLPTGRPIVHYLYDLDEYSNTRGLNLSTNELPGVVAYSAKELVGAVQESVDGLNSLEPGSDLARSPLQGDKYRLAQERFCSQEDGHASKRAIEFFFKDEIEGTPVRIPRDSRPTVLYWAGGLEDGREAESFLGQVVTSGKSNTFQTVFVVDRGAHISKGPLKSIKSLKSNISTIPYDYAEPVLRDAEREVFNEFTNLSLNSLDDVRGVLRGNVILRSLFRREYRRRLGDSQFDKVVLAPGLTNYELALAAFASSFNSLADEGELKNRIADQQNELNQMKHSTSWKITAPLRAVIRLLRAPVQFLFRSLGFLRRRMTR